MEPADWAPQSQREKKNVTEIPCLQRRFHLQLILQTDWHEWFDIQFKSYTQRGCDDRL